MNARDGAASIKTKDGKDQMSVVIKHRKHAAIGDTTLCGAWVNPHSWINLGALTSILQLTCVPCTTTLFWQDRIELDGSIKP